MIDFSVITATYNMEQTVAACLASVQKNKLDHTEHIVVDGLSSDRTIDIVRQYPDVDYISEKDRGVYDAMNKGIRRSHNEILSFLNADDYYLDGVLEIVRKTFETHPESDIVHGNILVNGRICKPAKWIASFGGTRIFHPAAFIRRSLFEKLGMYDEKYRICADLDFFFRAKEAGAVFTHIDQPLTVFALDGLSTTERSQTASEVRDVLMSHGYSALFSHSYCAAMKLRGVLSFLKCR